MFTTIDIFILDVFKMPFQFTVPVTAEPALWEPEMKWLYLSTTQNNLRAWTIGITESRRQQKQLASSAVNHNILKIIFRQSRSLGGWLTQNAYLCQVPSTRNQNIWLGWAWERSICFYSCNCPYRFRSASIRAFFTERTEYWSVPKPA